MCGGGEDVVRRYAGSVTRLSQMRIREELRTVEDRTPGLLESLVAKMEVRVMLVVTMVGVLYLQKIVH